MLCVQFKFYRWAPSSLEHFFVTLGSSDRIAVVYFKPDACRFISKNEIKTIKMDKKIKI